MGTLRKATIPLSASYLLTNFRLARVAREAVFAITRECVAAARTLAAVLARIRMTGV